MHRIHTSSNRLHGASDASLKDGRATHAWILSSGNTNDIEDPDLHLSGWGPVDGRNHSMSTSHGELHGITALPLMAKLHLQFHSSTASVEAICDNINVISCCSTPFYHKLQCHREANINLYLTRKLATKYFPIHLQCVLINLPGSVSLT